MCSIKGGKRLKRPFPAWILCKDQENTLFLGSGQSERRLIGQVFRFFANQSMSIAGTAFLTKT